MDEFHLPDKSNIRYDYAMLPRFLDIEFDILHNYNDNNFRFSTDVSSNIVLALKKYGILDESTTNYNIENSTPEKLIPYLLARLSAAVANGNKHY